ncbi:MAG: retroviral-like aspartic protease family protein [Leptolyngbyaceae cyanobacterium bins.59]|nr:retroviral-like aspartic protease family protein [Leptolyngbyaceae cyanobacterium bins.59]
MSARQSPKHLSLQPLFLCLGLLTLGITACQSAEQTPSPPSPAAVASPVTPTPSPRVARTPAPPSPDPYELAMDKAVSANSISKSAQSATDWELAAAQWKEAIALMKTVPTSSPYQAMAKLRVKEFERQLAATQIQVRSFPTTSEPNRVGVVPPLSSGSSSNSPALLQAPGSRVYQLPIKRRTGRTPVVAVTFDGKRTYDMIVDTGASSTVITPKMAAELGVVGVDRAIVDTASAKGLEVPVGYVNTIEAGGLLRRQVPVIIATSELEIGLLGHNFFGDYDITIRQDIVEFRAR